MTFPSILHQVASTALAAENRAHLHQICTLITGHLGARWYWFTMRMGSDSFIEPKVLVLDGFPEGWSTCYRNNDWILFDPSMSHAYTRTVPVFWEQVFAPVADNSPGAALRQSLRDHAMHTGVTMPMHGPNGEVSVLNLAWDSAPVQARPGLRSGGQDQPSPRAGPGASGQADNQADDQARFRIHRRAADRRLGDGFYLLAHLHEAASRVGALEWNDALPSALTKRERECLIWCAEGKTSWETAQILGITERTVIFHLRNVSGKLGVTNRQQAVARAAVRGIIVPRISKLPDSD